MGSFKDMIAQARSRAASQKAALPNFYSKEGLLNDEYSRYTGSRAAGTSATDDAVGRMQSFDASKAVDDYAKGAYSKISTALGQRLETLGGEAVGAGRFDSGFYDKDQGQVVRGAMDDFTSNLAQQSVAATGMQQQNTRDLLDYGEGQTETADNILMARRDEYAQAAANKKARRRGIGAAIGGVIGGVGGAILGGPAGAAAGWQIGSGAGQYV